MPNALMECATQMHILQEKMRKCLGFTLILKQTDLQFNTINSTEIKEEKTLKQYTRTLLKERTT